MFCSVYELRQLGFQVKIKHQRRYRFVPVRDFFITKGEMKFDNTKEISRILEELKDDINSYLDMDASNKAERSEKNIAINNLFEIDNNSGLTVVNIYRNDVEIGHGEAKVNESAAIEIVPVLEEDKDIKVEYKVGKRDTFNKKVGLQLALDNAIKDAQKNGNINIQDLIAEINDLRKKELEANMVEEIKVSGEI